ncbi:MAG TPA: methylmalonyl Co-A mutase-associated GTPase MeaB [Acidobacteriota bacterium]|nr:methylmalonyl Co-A mutase-associated GTPase MeaB [Acidobacteriota bacterium]
MNDSNAARIADRVEKIARGDVRAVARVLTELEQTRSTETRDLLRQIYPLAGQALVIGVTGSPGSGKSTLVARMALHYREAGLKVGIIAVDPTSPFSGGAILGDRIRMQALASDPGVYIRSMATRGQLGGLSAAVEDALSVLDAAGYRMLLLETVGVGQDEIDIVSTAHVTLLVLVPGMGDGIQAIKAGVMEIADIFVINKADHPETPRAERELRSFLKMIAREDGWNPPLVKTIATTGQGVDELINLIQTCHDFQTGRQDTRKKAVQRQRLLRLVSQRLVSRIVNSVKPEELDHLIERLDEREIDLDSVLEELVRRAGIPPTEPQAS